MPVYLSLLDSSNSVSIPDNETLSLARSLKRKTSLALLYVVSMFINTNFYCFLTPFIYCLFTMCLNTMCLFYLLGYVSVFLSMFIMYVLNVLTCVDKLVVFTSAYLVLVCHGYTNIGPW